MAEVGEIFRNVEIVELAFGGDGVARLSDGAVVFVPYTAVGDVADIEITESHKTFNRGEVVKFVKPHNHEKPACPYYGRCGGCAYQHLSYQDELAAKQLQFRSVMSRIGHFDSFPELEKFVASPLRYGYRNKLRLEPIVPRRPRGRGPVRPAPLGHDLAYGFCQRDNETFFPVKSCPLAMDAINAVLHQALDSDWAKQNARKPQPGSLTLRQDATGKCSYYFGFASSKLPWLHESLMDQDTSVPVGSFWQINPPVAKEILTTIRQWLEPVAARALIDAYAGVGTFSLALGDLFQYRVIIESDPQAVNASRFNHKNRNLKGQFIASPTEDALEKVLAQVKATESVVVLDPPRTGCLPKVIKALRDFTPSTIIYVSCNPTTLARDLKLLCQDGCYTPVKAACFDMFPATAHFESAVMLQCPSSLRS